MMVLSLFSNAVTVYAEENTKSALLESVSFVDNNDVVIPTDETTQTIQVKLTFKEAVTLNSAYVEIRAIGVESITGNLFSMSEDSKVATVSVNVNSSSQGGDYIISCVSFSVTGGNSYCYQSQNNNGAYSYYQDNNVSTLHDGDYSQESQSYVDNGITCNMGEYNTKKIVDSNDVLDTLTVYEVPVRKNGQTQNVNLTLAINEHAKTISSVSVTFAINVNGGLETHTNNFNLGDSIKVENNQLVLPLSIENSYAAGRYFIQKIVVTLTDNTVLTYGSDNIWSYGGAQNETKYLNCNNSNYYCNNSNYYCYVKDNGYIYVTEGTSYCPYITNVTFGENGSLTIDKGTSFSVVFEIAQVDTSENHSISYVNVNLSGDNNSNLITNSFTQDGNKITVTFNTDSNTVSGTYKLSYVNLCSNNLSRSYQCYSGYNSKTENDETSYYIYDNDYYNKTTITGEGTVTINKDSQYGDTAPIAKSVQLLTTTANPGETATIKLIIQKGAPIYSVNVFFQAPEVNNNVSINANYTSSISNGGSIEDDPSDSTQQIITLKANIPENAYGTWYISNVNLMDINGNYIYYNWLGGNDDHYYKVVASTQDESDKYYLQSYNSTGTKLLEVINGEDTKLELGSATAYTTETSTDDIVSAINSLDENGTLRVKLTGEKIAKKEIFTALSLDTNKSKSVEFYTTSTTSSAYTYKFTGTNIDSTKIKDINLGTNIESSMTTGYNTVVNVSSNTGSNVELPGKAKLTVQSYYFYGYDFSTIYIYDTSDGSYVALEDANASITTANYSGYCSFDITSLNKYTITNAYKSGINYSINYGNYQGNGSVYKFANIGASVTFSSPSFNITRNDGNNDEYVASSTSEGVTYVWSTIINGTNTKLGTSSSYTISSVTSSDIGKIYVCSIFYKNQCIQALYYYLYQDVDDSDAIELTSNTNNLQIVDENTSFTSNDGQYYKVFKLKSDAYNNYQLSENHSDNQGMFTITLIDANSNSHYGNNNVYTLEGDTTYYLMVSGYPSNNTSFGGDLYISYTTQSSGDYNYYDDDEYWNNKHADNVYDNTLGAYVSYELCAKYTSYYFNASTNNRVFVKDENDDDVAYYKIYLIKSWSTGTWEDNNYQSHVVTIDCSDDDLKIDDDLNVNYVDNALGLDLSLNIYSELEEYNVESFETITSLKDAGEVIDLTYMSEESPSIRLDSSKETNKIYLSDVLNFYNSRKEYSLQWNDEGEYIEDPDNYEDGYGDDVDLTIKSLSEDFFAARKYTSDGSYYHNYGAYNEYVYVDGYILTPGTCIVKYMQVNTEDEDNPTVLKSYNVTIVDNTSEMFDTDHTVNYTVEKGTAIDVSELLNDVTSDDDYDIDITFFANNKGISQKYIDNNVYSEDSSGENYSIRNYNIYLSGDEVGTYTVYMYYYADVAGNDGNTYAEPQLKKINVTVTEAQSHNYTSETILKATCVDTGIEKLTCSDCNQEVYRILPSNPEAHSEEYEVHNQTYNVTCGQEAYTGDSYCNYCHQLIQQGHTYTVEHEWYFTPSFYEYSGGYNASLNIYCSNGCQTNHNVQINSSSDGSNGTVELVDQQYASCNVTGYKKYKITFNLNESWGLGSTYVYEYENRTAAYKHNYASYTTSSEATCDDPAKEVSTCSYCSNKDIRTKSGSTALGHTWVKVENEDNKYKCSGCDKTIIKGDVDVNHITITGESNVYVGDTLTLSAHTYSADNTVLEDTVVWKTSDKEVATIDNEGKITPITSGTVVITATSYNGKTSTKKIEVKEHTTNISVNADFTLDLGGSKKLSTVLTPSTSTDEITYTSSNSSVASVTSKGVVLAKSAGTATITATSNGKTASCTVTVNASAFTLDKTTYVLTPGEEAVIYEKDANDTSYYWAYSNNVNIATVDRSTMTVTAQDLKGKTTVSLYSSAKNATAYITIYVVDAAEDNVVNTTIDNDKFSSVSGISGVSTNNETISVVQNTVDKIVKEIIESSYSNSVSDLTSENIQSVIDNGDSIETNFNVDPVDASDVDESVLSDIQNASSDDVQLLDISLSLTDGDNDLGNIEELDNPITVTIDLGEEYDANADYHIIRDHNGVVTDITATKDDATNSISFETNQFSVYGLYAEGACDHTYNDGVVTKQPTCTETGVKTYTCTKCGNTYTEDIDKVAHTLTQHAAVEPTCTTAGKTEGKHCSVCNAVITAQTIVPAKGHTYTTSHDDTKKCTVYTCSTCSHSYSVDDPKEEEKVTSSQVSTINTDTAKSDTDKTNLETIKSAVTSDNTIEVTTEKKVEEVPADKIENDTTKATEVIAIKEKLGVTDNSTSQVVKYIDLSVVVSANVNNNNKVEASLAETPNKISFTIDAPKQTLEDGKTYVVVRYHNGVAEILSSTFKNGKITFETDKFSTYAIVEHTHSYTSSVTKAAQVGVKGVKTYTCVCGDSYTEDIAALTAPTTSTPVVTTVNAHTHAVNSSKVTTKATLTTTGVKTNYCSCGEVVSTEKVAKLTKGTMYKGNTMTLKSGVTSGKITWTSSKKSVATINKNGKITAKKAGTTKITLKVNGKKVATYKLTVKNKTLKLNVSKVTLNRNNYKTYTITAKTSPSAKVTYTSLNKKVATVNANGKITAKKKGTVKIKVKANGITKYVKVTVK